MYSISRSIKVARAISSASVIHTTSHLGRRKEIFTLPGLREATATVIVFLRVLPEGNSVSYCKEFVVICQEKAGCDEGNGGNIPDAGYPAFLFCASNHPFLGSWRATSRKTLPSGRRRKTTHRGLGCLRGGTFAKVLSPLFYVYVSSVSRGGGFTPAPATENLQKGFGEGECLFLKKALPRKHSTPPQTHKR